MVKLILFILPPGIVHSNLKSGKILLFGITKVGMWEIQIIHECKLGSVNEGQVEAYTGSLKVLCFCKYFHHRSSSKQVFDYKTDALTLV